jgi:serine/threonine protein kinase
MRKNLPDISFFMNKPLPGLDGYYIDEHLGSGLNAHVFRAHSDSVKHDIACKIIPAANLKMGPNGEDIWKAEIHKANVLDTDIPVKISQFFDWNDYDNGVKYIAFISDFIRGENLENFLKSNRTDLTVPFVELFLSSMLIFFHDMEHHNVIHGDLHLKNIMVEDRSNQLGQIPSRFRVTDFGVVSATGDATLKDDWDQLACILRDILMNIQYDSIQNSRDRYAYNIINDDFLARHLVERDITRDPIARHPEDLYNKLNDLDRIFNSEFRDSQYELITPFDFLSCEQIGERHTLLKALYSDLFLGISQIESKNNLVITGPRGCGKSTVFKSLSLRHRTKVKDDIPSRINYVGVYYRCDDLYSVFPRYQLPGRDEAFDIATHYMISTLLIELLSSLQIWADTYFEEEFKGRYKTSICICSIRTH